MEAALADGVGCHAHEPPSASIEEARCDEASGGGEREVTARSDRSMLYGSIFTPPSATMRSLSEELLMLSTVPGGTRTPNSSLSGADRREGDVRVSESQSRLSSETTQTRLTSHERADGPGTPVTLIRMWLCARPPLTAARLDQPQHDHNTTHMCTGRQSTSPHTLPYLSPPLPPTPPHVLPCRCDRHISSHSASLPYPSH